MRCVRLPLFGIFAVAITLWASQPWSKDPSQWTSAERQKILTDSPWAQQAQASFGKKLEPEDMPVTPPPGGEGGMAGARWDGGVARNTGVGETPTLPVTIRWDSAIPVREALARSQDSVSQPPQGYAITVLGLATAGPIDEAQKQAFLANTRLIPRGRTAIVPQNLEVDSTGAVHFFFPRTEPIALSDKEVTFETRFGSIGVQKRFRLKEMVYKGQLAL